MIQRDDERLFALFQGSPLAVGTEEGGCQRVANIVEYATIVKQHFTNEAVSPIGTYPMRFTEGEWKVKWSCVDIDFERHGLVEGLTLAWQIVARAIDLHGFYGHVEKSRSKGWHVWFLYDQWVPAWAGRWWLADICTDLGFPSIEVNPKQVHLNEGQLGNYVRLPMPYSKRHEEGRKFVCNTSTSLMLDSFEDHLISSTDACFASRHSTQWAPSITMPRTVIEYRVPTGEGGAWRQQKCANLLVDHTAIMVQGSRDDTVHALARLMHGLHWPFVDACAKLTEICLNQSEPPFDTNIAVGKLRRIYGGQS